MYKIDVNGDRVRKCKKGETLSCIRITEGYNVWFTKEVRLLGPSKLVQINPDKEDPNKTFIWLETDGPIEWD